MLHRKTARFCRSVEDEQEQEQEEEKEEEEEVLWPFLEKSINLPPRRVMGGGRKLKQWRGSQTINQSHRKQILLETKSGEPLRVIECRLRFYVLHRFCNKFATHQQRGVL